MINPKIMRAIQWTALAVIGDPLLTAVHLALNDEKSPSETEKELEND